MISKESQGYHIFGNCLRLWQPGETAQTFLMMNLDLDGYPYLEREIKLSCGKPL